MKVVLHLYEVVDAACLEVIPCLHRKNRIRQRCQSFAVTVECRIRKLLNLFVDVRRCPRRPSLLVRYRLRTTGCWR